MIFADLQPEMQGRVIAKAWQAIKLEPGAATDDLMAEWIDGLQRLSVDEIALGVKACQRAGCTAPIEDFVVLCTAKPEAQAAKLPTIDSEGITETFEESYHRCGLADRWGPLPKEHSQKGVKP